MDLGFTPGDTVVVTGAGSGIGRAVAGLAARAGLRVVGWDIVPGPGLVTVDVSSPEAVEAALAETGSVKHLVNNAGPASTGQLDFDRALALTAGSVHLVTDAWLRGDPPEGASVVNIASVAGNFVGIDSGWYSAGKAAIAGYTRHLATQHGGRIRANAIAPGLIDTPRTAGLSSSDLGRALVARNPLRRSGTPQEVAGAVLFLLSPLAAYVNGVLLPVDGGWMVTQ